LRKSRAGNTSPRKPLGFRGASLFERAKDFNLITKILGENRIIFQLWQTIDANQMKGVASYITTQSSGTAEPASLIGAHETAFQKMSNYAQMANDPQIRAYFEKSAQSAQSTKQKLMSFLS
jgi:hypothetical protein